jgi:hypothetical protein
MSSAAQKNQSHSFLFLFQQLFRRQQELVQVVAVHTGPAQLFIVLPCHDYNLTCVEEQDGNEKYGKSGHGIEPRASYRTLQPTQACLLRRAHSQRIPTAPQAPQQGIKVTYRQQQMLHDFPLFELQKMTAVWSCGCIVRTHDSL